MRNLGLYRLQRHDRRTIGMHWQIHKDSRNHYQVAAKRGEQLPVAIAFGCPPAVTYASTAPLPGDIDEYLFAGFLQGKRIEMVDCKTVPLQVPAHAEVVIEGWLEPGEMLPEGPFGDHTGFYTPQEPFPALTIDCVTMRKRPLLQSIVVGRPPTEDGPLGRATERFFLPLLKIIVPDIVDYHLPESGGFHNCAIVSIDKKYPKHAQKVMHAIWGAHMMSLTKLIVVVDADCDVHDLHEVSWRALGNTDYARDLTVVEGPVDHLDHASYQQFWGGKAGIDATAQVARGGLHARRRLAAHGRVRPADGGDWSTAAGRSTASREQRIRSASRSRAGDQGLPAPRDDRALGLRAALRLHRRADRDVPWDRHVHWGELLLVTVAMVGLRTFAMAANRIIDREIDARNPRTAHRELVTGAVSVRSAWTGRADRAGRLPGRRRAAQPAVPGARAARGGADGGLSVRQAVHRTSRTPSSASPRRWARSAPGSRSPAPGRGRRRSSASRSASGSAAST